MDISELTKKPATVSNHENRGNPTSKKKKRENKTRRQNKGIV
jgi:hypothetical protein